MESRSYSEDQMAKHVVPGTGVEGLPISDAVRAGDFVFLSGLVGFGPDGTIVDGGIVSETDRIMADAADILKRAKATLRDVVKVTVYLADAADFAAFNEAYARYFENVPPARITVVVSLTIVARIEMDFIAYTGE
jgi:2-iminobutanoate/2-iminopropanoate deaminase